MAGILSSPETMLILLSPAKRIDASLRPSIKEHSKPELTGRAKALVERLRSLSPDELASLMGISDQLAVMNAGRYADWSEKHDFENAKQAIFTFDGDVYRGMKAATFSDAQLEWAQEHIRILSGLYGLLRPLDLIHPYRLEMGTRLPNPSGKDLYAFWGDTITDIIERDLKRRKWSVVVNLASEEYSRAVDTSKLGAMTVTPVFQEWSNGKWKVIAIHAKRARGLMARFAAVHGLDDASGLKAFDSEGYGYDRSASDDRRWIFRRGRD